MIEVKIGEDIARMGIAIVVLNRDNNKAEVINLYTGEIKKLETGELIPDNFIIKLSDYVAQEFLQGLAEALDKRGIKTDKDAKIQGLLEATKYHLEDMRKIVFAEERKQPTEY